MTPKQVTDVDMSRITKKKLPSLTWKIDREEGQVRGALDEAEAMRQAVEKILQTERYRFVIYDWNYGMELDDLIGKNASFVIPELKRRIEDALLADDRVTAVTDFYFSQERDSVAADFLVHTIFGELRAERTVDI